MKFWCLEITIHPTADASVFSWKQGLIEIKRPFATQSLTEYKCNFNVTFFHTKKVPFLSICIQKLFQPALQPPTQLENILRIQTVALHSVHATSNACLSVSG